MFRNTDVYNIYKKYLNASGTGSLSYSLDDSQSRDPNLWFLPFKPAPSMSTARGEFSYSKCSLITENLFNFIS